MAKSKETTKVTLKGSEVLASVEAFSALDKCKFEPKILLAIARTGIALKNAAQVIFQARDQLAKQYFKDGKIDTEHSKFPEYKEKVEEVIAEPVEVEVLLLTEDDLALSENDIPVSILMSLQWLIKS